MRIQNNIPAYNAHRNYNLANASISSSAEKLSSGYRINRAGDDAAGLAISEKMRAQIRGLEMASKNTADAVSMVATAEGALQKSHDILQRMRELAVQSASDTNQTLIDREALDQEFQALKEEIDDIARVTRFNDQNLIDGTFQANRSFLSLNTAGGSTATSVAGLGNKLAITVDGAKAGLYTVTLAAVTAQTSYVSAGTAAVATVNASLTGTVFSAVSFTGAVTGAHNGNTYTLSLDASSQLDNATITLLDSNKQAVGQVHNVDLTKWTTTTNGSAQAFSLNFANVGSINITVSASTDGVQTREQVDSFFDTMSLAFGTAGADSKVIDAETAAIRLTVNGESATVMKGDTTATFVDTGISVRFFDALSDADVASTAAFGVYFAEATSRIVVGNESRAPMVIQSGANQYDETRINIDAMNTRFLGINNASIDTRVNASRAITQVNNAINKVSTQRAALGALQNRLTFKGENLDISAENLTAAESRIRDVDMAKEMTAFSKKNIVSQAATAMLAQANTLPQNVLQLLR